MAADVHETRAQQLTWRGWVRFLAPLVELAAATAGCGNSGLARHGTGAPSAPARRTGAGSACPRDVLPLGQGFASPARAEAVRYLRRLYPLARRSQLHIEEVAPAASNVDYGKIVELECPDVSDRVVVVEYTLGPTRGAVAGATTNAVFVSHFADGWRVWLQSG